MDRWEYLLTRQYKIRHYICEYYLKDVIGVIDVGAYKHTIDWDNVIAIDPLGSMEKSYHGTVAEWVKEPYFFNIEDCGVVALGLEIEGSDESEWNAFVSLAEKCKVLILEHSIDHIPSVEQVEMIMSLVNKQLITVMHFEICDVETPGFTPHNKRRLIVLERK